MVRIITAAGHASQAFEQARAPHWRLMRMGLGLGAAMILALSDLGELIDFGHALWRPANVDAEFGLELGVIQHCRLRRRRDARVQRVSGQRRRFLDHHISGGLPDIGPRAAIGGPAINGIGGR